MTASLRRGFRVGAWTVLADECRIREGDTVRHVRPLVMDLLIRLAHEPGQVVARDDLLASVWQHRFVNEAALSRTIRELRQALGDTCRTPSYIETVPKRGYRLIAPVGHSADSTGTRIVVLPFRSDSHTADEESFADGLVDALIAELARLGGVRIISHQTADHLRGTTRSLPDIARELQADAVIEGSVVRGDSHVRVTAVLLQPDPEQQLWADSFESGLDDLVDLQGRLARTIAQAAHGALTRS